MLDLAFEHEMVLKYERLLAILMYKSQSAGC